MAVLVLGVAAHPGFVNEHGAFQQAPQWIAAHGVADAVTQVPRRPIRAQAQLALQLQSRDALLGAAQDGKGHKPNADREVRAFQDRVDRHAELLRATVVALPNTSAVLFSLQFRVTVNTTAVRADNAVGPHDAL